MALQPWQCPPHQKGFIVDAVDVSVVKLVIVVVVFRRIRTTKVG